MARARSSPATTTRGEFPATTELTDQEMLRIYQEMVLARLLDERAWLLNRQGKAPIVASCQGHEGAQVGIAWAVRRSGDCFLFSYYRDLALLISLGITPKELLLSFLAKAGEPFNGARQFPSHGAYLQHNLINLSNVVGTQLPQAVGYALGCRLLREPTVVLVFFGDGASSTGECHEAMNFAGIHKLPIVFVCENNRYATSVPLGKQMAVRDVADRAAGYGFPGVVVDGMEPLGPYRATLEAIQRARQGQGPTLVEAKVERFLPHTSDDDDRKYRPREELEALRKRDPVPLLRTRLLEQGILTEGQDKAFQEEAKVEVNEATEFAEAAPYPEPSSFSDHVYAP
ncbi:MAG: thiamine pyrophosphate-dependent dehydrogenase E1 component subunit alpha [Dehalococcoidia bacterium]